jgi:predicted TIM-barrel fold metal-dependent hydrolase
MLVAGDVHTHVWAPGHVSAAFMDDLLRAWPEAADLDAGYDAHARHAEHAGRSVVLAFDARHAGLVVPDEFVAEYVHRDPERLVGFASVDPARPDAVERLERAVQTLGLRGLKLAPTYQNVDPLSPAAAAVFDAADDLGLPVLIHQGVTFVRNSVMAYALPRQIDEVALRHPRLRIVIAHMGHPWTAECVAVIRKHPNVYADISALAPRPMQFRTALVEAGEYRAADKLLFGTDWPFGTLDAQAGLLRRWRDDEAEPAVLRETASAILAADPLAAIGLEP